MDRTPSRPLWPRVPLLLAVVAVLLAAAALLTAALLRGTSAADAAPSAPLALAPPARGAVADELEGATPVPSMSTETSRTLRRPDGMYVTRIFATAPSFRDAHGTEHVIDQTLRPVLGGYQPAAAPVPTTFPATLARPIAIDRDGTPFSMRLIGATGRPTTSGSTITYTNALRDTDVSYTSSDQALGEAFHLTGPGAPARFAFDIRTGAGVTAAKQPNGTIAFTRADGSALIALAPSFATADAVQGHHEQPVDTEVAVAGDGFRVTQSVDPAWLSAQLAHGGTVTIDPTVELQGAARDCPLSSDTPSTSYCGNGGLWVGWNGDHDHHSLLKWDLSAIPRDAEALWGDVGLFQPNTGPANAKQLTMSPLSRDWTSGATWSTYDGTHAWTTPGGDADAPVATASLGRYHRDWVDWYATPLVQDWLTGDQANYGVMFADAPGARVVGEEDFLSTSGSQSPATKPELDIAWTPRLGVVDGGTFDGQPLDDNTGIAVNVANGNLFLQTRGMQVAGTGLDLNEQIYHNSLGSPTELQGVGIKGTGSLGRDVKLKAFDPSTVAFYRGDGDVASFTASTTSGTTQTFLAPDELSDDTVLTRDTGTGLYTLRSPSGLPAWPGIDVTLTFAASGALKSIADTAGHRIALSYYSDGGSDIPSPSRITDTNNANYTVTRTDVGDSYLGDIADPAGHHWHYTYGHDDGDYLMSFSAGDTGRTWGYDYDTSNRLTKVVTPDGNVTLIRYDGTSSRAAAIVRTTDAAHTTGPTTTYTYSAPTAPCDASAGDINKTVVTPPTGPAVTFCSDVYDQTTYDDRATGDTEGCDSAADPDDDDTSAVDCTLGDDLSSYPSGDDAFGGSGSGTQGLQSLQANAVPATFGWGFADQHREFLLDRAPQNVIVPPSALRYVRRTVGWNVVSDSPQYRNHAVNQPDPATDPKGAKRWKDLHDLESFVADARARGAQVMISFELCHTIPPGTTTTLSDADWCGLHTSRPSSLQYKNAVAAFRNWKGADPTATGHPDFSAIQFYTAWNEPDHGNQPTDSVNSQSARGVRSTVHNSGAFQAGRYLYELSTVCTSPCKAGAGDFSDWDMLNVLNDSSQGRLYFSQYRAGMRKSPPSFWAWHSYSDTVKSSGTNTASNWKSLKAFLRATEIRTRSTTDQPAVFIDEVGVTYGTRSGQSSYIKGDDNVASLKMQRLVHQAPTVRYGTDARTARRIKGLFYYQLRGADRDFDSGLIDPTTTNNNLNNVRPMWLPWCQAVITGVSGASCNPAVVHSPAPPPTDGDYN